MSNFLGYLIEKNTFVVFRPADSGYDINYSDAAD